MPTNRRRRLQGRRSNYTSPRVVEKLLCGHDFDFLDLALGSELNETELRATWEELRDELLAQHIADKPGTRPWAWWKWDAPEPRRQIGPGPEALGPANWFGMPSSFAGMPPAGMFETEADYLRRLRLLTPAERRLHRG